MRWLVVCAAACMAGGVRAQPIQCSEDHQCSSGSYCDPELHFCLACLSCQSLKREPPPVASSCVRYVTECGPCLKGLVSASDGGGESCTAPADVGLPPYMWALIALCLLLFCVFVTAVLVYILRHKDTFKFTSATCVETQRTPHEPAPPTAPPPYDGAFDSVRPSSPPLAGTAESEAPLVKRAGSSRAAGARESAARQAARVFNNPHYVRGPHLPPSPPTYEEAFSDGSDHEGAFVPPPDEDTMESMWTPDESGGATSRDTEAGSATAVSVPETSGASALARRPERSELAPPAKVHCVREDSNNNRGGESSGSRGQPAPAASLPASLVINVMNVNTVHQLNDLSL